MACAVHQGKPMHQQLVTACGWFASASAMTTWPVAPFYLTMSAVLKNFWSRERKAAGYIIIVQVSMPDF